MASHLNDKTTVADVGIAYPHWEIHNGDHFFMTFTDTDFDAEIRYLTIVVPNTTRWVHFFYKVEASAILTVTLQEDAVPDPEMEGPTIPTYNSNRNSTKVSGLLIRSDDEYLANGNTIRSYTGGSATAQAKAAGGERAEDEFVLKQGSTYQLKIEGGTADQRMAVLLEWYEHTNYLGLGAIT